MADLEFVNPSTGAALGTHAFGTVAAGSSSAAWAIRLRYKWGQSGSGLQNNALVLQVSEDGGVTYRDAVAEFSLAITAVVNTPSDPLYTESVRTLGRGTRWTLAPLRAGCAVDLSVTFAPDLRTGTATTSYVVKLGVEYNASYRIIDYVPDAPTGVLSGLGAAGVNEWVTAPTLTNDTDKVTLGAGEYVFDGTAHDLAGGDVTLSQDDGNGVTLASGQEYKAVLSVGSAGTVTTTKGGRATAGSSAYPAYPSGEMPLASVTVPFGGVIVTSTLHAVSGRCLVADGGGLVVTVQPGRAVMPGYYLTPPIQQSLTLTDNGTPATGTITCVDVANLIDGETVTVAGTVYEFDVAGNGVTAGNEAVDVSTVATAAEVAAILAYVIDGIGDVAAVDNLDGTISLTHMTTGTTGNVAITETVADAGFLVSGMSGGASGSHTVYLSQSGTPNTTAGVPLATVLVGAADIVSITDARRWVDGFDGRTLPWAPWDDICTLSPTAVNPTGPDGSMTVITDASGYIGCLQADAIGESCTVVWQLDHRYKLGTDIKPHIHVVRNDGADNTGNVEFECKFRHLPLRGTASAWTANVAGSTDLQPADGADESGVIYWTLADSTYNFGISDCIVAVIRRSALTTGSVAVTSLDVHGQLGQLGSASVGSL